MTWSNVVQGLSSQSVAGGTATEQTGVPFPGTPVTGTAVDWEVVRAIHAAQVTVTGVTGDGNLTVSLMGSLDGSNWYQLASVTGFSGGATTVQLVSTGVQPAQWVQVTAVATTNAYEGGAEPVTFEATATVLVTSQ